MTKILVKSLGIEPVAIGEKCDGYIDDAQEIAELKKEFELVKQEIQQLVMEYLSDPRTSKELRSYLTTDAKVRKLMENNSSYRELCVNSIIITRNGMIFDEAYQ
jgi:hypothetical protein